MFKQVLNNANNRWAFKKVMILRVKDGLKKLLTISGVKDPFHSEGPHRDWEVLELWIALLLFHIISEVLIIDIGSSMSVQRDNIFRELFLHFECLFVQHLNGLERKFFHVKNEVLVLNQIREDILDGFAAIIVNG